MMKSPEFSIDNYRKDKIRAIEARFEAQKIAFAPLTFQAIKALIDLGILHLIETQKMTVFQLARLWKKPVFLNTEYGF